MIISRYFIIPSLHPLLPITIALIIGIALQQLWLLPFTIIYWLPIPFVAFLISRYYKTTEFTLVALCLNATLIGAALVAYRYHQFDRFHQIYHGKATIRGIVKYYEPIDHPRFNYQLQLTLSALAPQATVPWQECSGNCLIYLCKKPSIAIGDTIEVAEVSLKKPKGDFARYLIKEGYETTICCNTLNATIISRPSWNSGRFISDMRHRFLHHLENTLSPATFALVASIFLGNRIYVKQQMQTTKDIFKTWGISHYLARSGLHVVLFIMIWAGLLALLPLAYRYQLLLLMLIILLYALLSWSSVSFERAVLMFLLSKSAGIFGYATHYIHVITLATLIVLLLNPLQLFFLDFQLSFGFTFALAWFGQLEAEKRRGSRANT